MLRSESVASWTVALCLAVSCSHGPPTRYDLNQPQRWEVAEIVTRTERSESSMALLDDEAGAPKVVRSHLQESHIVQRCLETDDNDALRRSLVYVASWLDREGSIGDRSLEHAFVETSPTGWSLVSNDVRPSPKAREWLDSQFGPASRHEAAAAGFWAPHPLAVGEGWDAPSAEMVRQMLGAPDLALPGNAADVHILLAGVSSTPHGVSVHVTETLDAPVTSGPAASGAHGPRYAAGTRVSMRGECTFVPGRAQRSSDKTFGGESTLVLVDAGNEIRAVIKSSERSTSASGGEMPEPPPK